MAGSGAVEVRTRDAERTRQGILDAAEQLFAARGYRGTSLQDIGDAAGVSRGTPSYFFGSKDGVYRAVLERSFTVMAEGLRGVRQRATAPEEALRAQIEEYLDFLVAHPTFLRLVEWEALTGGEVLGEFAPYLSVTAEALESVEAAVEGEGEALHLLISVVSMCWYPLSHKDTLMRALGVDPQDAAFVAARKRHIAELLLRALGR